MSKKNIKENEPETTLKPLVEGICRDGCVTDITGTPLMVHSTVETREDEETGEEYKWEEHFLTIGINGETKTIHISKTALWKLSKRLVEQREQIVATKDNGGELKLQSPSPYLFRCMRNNNTGDDAKDLICTAIVTDHWKKVKIEEVVEGIKQVFENDQNVTINTLPSNGMYGGSAEINFEPDAAGIFRPSIIISAGKLDGRHSFNISGGCTILTCSNQLTSMVREEIKPLIKSFTIKNKLHLEKTATPEIIKLEVIEIKDEVTKNWLTAIKAAKTIKLNTRQLNVILEYYELNRGFSKKVMKLIEEEYKDPAIAQVPNTLYGLAMAVSHVGTHTVSKDGVKRLLSAAAGEILLVSKSYNQYARLVNKYVREEKEKIKVEVKTA